MWKAEAAIELLRAYRGKAPLSFGNCKPVVVALEQPPTKRRRTYRLCHSTHPIDVLDDDVLNTIRRRGNEICKGKIEKEYINTILTRDDLDPKMFWTITEHDTGVLRGFGIMTYMTARTREEETLMYYDGFELELICASHGEGMVLFRNILRWVRENEYDFLNLQAISASVARKYVDAARQEGVLARTNEVSDVYTAWRSDARVIDEIVDSNPDETFLLPMHFWFKDVHPTSPRDEG